MNLGLAVPESLVLPLPQTRAGEIAGARAATALRPYCAASNAVLIGPAWAHGASGALLEKRVGKVGFLARELLAEVPALLRN